MYDDRSEYVGGISVRGTSIVASSVGSAALVAYAYCWPDLLQLLLKLFGSISVLLCQTRCLCDVMFAMLWLMEDNHVEKKR